MLAPVTITRLEKAATDNGFDLNVERTADWLSFGSTQTSMRIWLTAIGESQLLAAMSRSRCARRIIGPRRGVHEPGPERRCRRAEPQRRCHTPSPVAPRVPTFAHAPGRAASCLPRRNREPATGDGSGTLGGAASWPGHLPPWSIGILGLPLCDQLASRCPSSYAPATSSPGPTATRTQNGSTSSTAFLLASHLDAAFDAGFITIAEDGTVLVSNLLPLDAQSVLGLDKPLNVRGLHRSHERYLPSHRTTIFRPNAENARVI